MNAHTPQFHPVARAHVAMPAQPANDLMAGDTVEFTLSAADAVWRGQIVRIVGGQAKVECTAIDGETHRFSAPLDALTLIRRADA